MKTSLIILIITVMSCKNTSQNIPGTDSSTAKKDSLSTKDTIRTSEVNDSVILIRFPAGSISTTVSANMKGINYPVTVLIPIKQGKQLSASIKTKDSIANIRINQIILPDGKADGPFGKELKRDIHQQGTYRLIISESMMQADEWKGTFMLTIKVE